MVRLDAKRRARRRVVAVLLVVVALVVLVAEPFAKGPVLLSVTRTHGIHAGDLPAIVLLLTAAWLAPRGWA
jgi:hypothetical protein